MGYFALLRELGDESRRLQEQALQEAERIGDDIDALVETAWRFVGKPRLITGLYAKAAEQSRRVALGLTRIQNLGRNDGETLRMLIEDGLGPLEPYVAAMLGTSDRERMLGLLTHTYSRFERPLLRLRELANGDDRASAYALRILAGSRRDDERRIVVDRLAGGRIPAEAALELRCTLARAGDASQDARLLIELTRVVEARKAAPAAAVAAGEARHLRRDDHSPLAGILAAVSKRKLVSAVPMLLELLPSFDCIEVLQALAEIGDRSARPAIRAFGDQVAGLPDANLPFRIAVDYALNTLGEEVSTDTAHEVFANFWPRRYGYPKLVDVLSAQMMAATILFDRGTEDDRRRVADLAGSSVATHREVGARAWEQLHGETPAVRLFDRPRVDEMMQREGATELLEALRAPATAFKGSIVAALLEQDDPEIRAETARWCKERLESQPNAYVETPDGTCPDNQALLSALAGLEEGDRKQWLAGTTSAWIRAFVLETEQLERPRWETRIAPGVDVEIFPFDGAPWIFGTQINGMALSPDATRLAVVGSQLGKIVDAASGEHVASLELGWNWGYDCAFSPDGKTLAACYHGGHVETYDAETGRCLREFPGHSGVPLGVKRLAISPDGSMLVTCGQDARVIAFDIDSGRQLWCHQAPPGSFEAIVFTPDGKRIIASHVNTSGGAESFLSLIDAESGEAARLDVEFSIWAIDVSADGSQIALGGDSEQIRLCDASFSELRRFDLSNTVRVCFSADASKLYAASSEGTLKVFAPGQLDSAGETLLEEGPLWALAVDETRRLVRAAGSDGTVHTAGGDRAPGARGVHTQQVRVLRQRDRLIYSAGWDGTLLCWSEQGGSGEEILAVENRINDCAVVSDGRAVLVTGDGLHLIRLSDGNGIASREGGYDAVALNADETEIAAGTGHGIELFDLDTFEPLGDPVTTSTGDVSAIVALEDGGWLVGSKEGEVTLVRDGDRVWTIADHGSDRLERGNPHKAVCDMLALPGGRFVSSGNDNTVRLYALQGAERPTLLKRIHTRCSIFNRMAVSVDGTVLASPAANGLLLFSLPAADTRVVLSSRDHFQSMQLTTALFVGDEELLVATESGRLFRVRCRGLRS